MRKLTKFKFTAQGGGSRSKYDWDRLLNGTTWKLASNEMNPRDDEEAYVAIVRFRRTAHAAAKARKLNLQTEVVDNTYLVIQARPAK